MINCSMLPSEMVRDARLDFPILRGKLDRPLLMLRNEFESSGGKEDIDHLLPWRSPNGNNWLVLVRYTRSGPSVHTMVWFRDRDEHIAALLISPKGLSYCIDANVIRIYGERVDPTESPIERLQTFFQHNYLFAMQPGEQQRGTDRSATIAMNRGLALGIWHRDEELVHVRSFLVDAALLQPAAISESDNTSGLYMASCDTALGLRFPRRGAA